MSTGKKVVSEGDKLRAEIIADQSFGQAWLETPNAWLDGKSPEQKIASGLLGEIGRVRQIMRTITNAVTNGHTP